jgi:phage-related protein
MSVNNKVRVFYVHFMSRLVYLLHNLDCSSSSTYACNYKHVMVFKMKYMVQHIHLNARKHFILTVKKY